MKKELIKKMITGVLTAAIIFLQVMLPISVKAEEFAVPDIESLVIHYESCTHGVNMGGIMESGAAACHDQVIVQGQNYIYDSVAGQEVKLPQSGEGWKYDIGSNTLTLTNFKGAGINAGDSFGDSNTMTIELVGDNTLTSTTADVHPIKIENINLKITGSGSLKILQKDGNDAALNVNRDIQLSGSCKVDVTGNTTAVNVGSGVAIQGNTSANAGGNLIVDKGCTLTARTAYKQEQKFMVTAINCISIKVGGTIIGETASGKENYNIGINAPYGYQIDKGITLKSGDSLDTAKVKSLQKYMENTVYNYSALAPYMELSEKAVTANVYKISYSLNGGINNKANPLTYDGSKNLSLLNPSKAGYTFAGWYTDSKLTKKITTIIKGYNRDFRVYAKWVASPKK